MFLRDERHGRHAGRRAKPIETGGGRDACGAPGAATLDGAIVPARRVKTPSHRPRSVWIWVGLVVAARVLRSRRFAALVTVGGIVLAALAQMSRKEIALAVKDLIAWDNARLADLQKRLRRQREAKVSQRAAG
jgi:hypothetical protein